MQSPPVNDSNLTRGELDRLRRFHSLYNRIDARLRELYPQGERRPGFPRLVNLYFRGKTNDAEPRFLRKLGDLRNSLVHGATRDDQYVAVPTGETLRQLLGTYRELMRSDLAINEFPKKVEKVTSDDTLFNVMGRMRDKGFSQFPVYDGRDFKGLLTENGVIQWLAESMFGESSIVESYDLASRRILLQSTSVKEVLKKDENKANVMFVENILTVKEVRQHFSENNLLAAILITENGRSGEELLAIATRWDVAGV